MFPFEPEFLKYLFGFVHHNWAFVQDIGLVGQEGHGVAEMRHDVQDMVGDYFDNVQHWEGAGGRVGGLIVGPGYWLTAERTEVGGGGGIAMTDTADVEEGSMVSLMGRPEKWAQHDDLYS